MSYTEMAQAGKIDEAAEEILRIAAIPGPRKKGDVRVYVPDEEGAEGDYRSLRPDEREKARSVAKQIAVLAGHKFDDMRLGSPPLT